ncbi:MAG TPA: hypothetical protein VK698_38840 [Kofleriaceae bacterium]|nr:hypothetical protein [Kofleriaceae bacterium]
MNTQTPTTTQTTTPTTTTPTTLILGGTGKTGSRVARRLTARGLPVRIASRAGAPPFDWNDESTWAAALRGVGALYLAYYPDLAVPGAAQHIRALARQAADGGVKRIVLLSGRGEPQVLPAEEGVRDSGAAFTILRAAWFAQNFSEGYLLDPVLAGEVAFPAGDVAEPFLDVDDIADIAAAALTTDRHAGMIYELTGPRLLTFADAVAEIARASGREIRYVPITSAQYGAALAEVMPAEDAGFLTELFRYVLDGHNAHLTDGVERALGRRPRDFADFARDAAAAGAWSR